MNIGSKNEETFKISIFRLYQMRIA